jgi:DNA gyrase subunit A
MSDVAKEISPITIEQELKQSYLDYAMSVIVGRALPDVRDGLKPVHRRVLFAMRELGNDYNKAYKKSARVVGDVIGKYHPHGDTAVYDTIVRMAQPFSMRCLLVDGQGNFGSVDGDSPAAMRYTEVRMKKYAHAMLVDLEKETVDFSPNYDETEMIPNVLPTRIPNLLINGSSGIAVGMATNIPPHNPNEVVDACLALIDTPELDTEGLMEHIKGPDFPTAGIISGREGIVSAYKTGRGRIYVRARAHTEDMKTAGRERIVITELPYQVNKARLVEKIAELVKDRKIEGISELRDESDKDGMRVVVELRRGENADVMLNNLYSHTQMQNVFGINMVALENNQPKVMNLKQILQAFVRHRQEVVTRRTIFELRKARERAHLLEGLAVALANIDEMIRIIKTSKSSGEAKERLLAKTWAPGLVKSLLEKVQDDACRPEGLALEYGLHNGEYRLSGAQVEAILELKLHRLTGLEQDKIMEEYYKLLEKIAGLLAILGDITILMDVIRKELREVKEQFGDERRTELTASSHDLSIEDLIAEEEMVVTLSNKGYIKRQPISDYRAQRRGGRGKAAAKVKDEEYIERLAISSTHATMLCFSSAGKLYWKKVYEFPVGTRIARGKPVNNVLPLEEGEHITAMLPVKSYEGEQYVFMATEAGVVKKTPLEAFSRPRTAGIRAINLDDGDQLIGVAITTGDQDVMLFSDAGKAVRMSEAKVRSMGRVSRGVRGIRLKPKQKVISLIIVSDDEGEMLTATVNGFGKRTKVSEFRTIGRGTQGVTSISTSDRNGHVVRAVWVDESDELMLITSGGTLVRTRAAEVSCVGRAAQGVKLINLTGGETLVGMQRIEDLGEDEDLEAGVEGEVTDATDNINAAGTSLPEQDVNDTDLGDSAEGDVESDEE